MTKLVFMGLMLTNKGIGPTEEKGKAVVKEREPQNALEVRSFLGLANYNAQFIPDFATVADLFCNLSKKGVCFRLEMSTEETLGYFDKDARTLIIADRVVIKSRGPGIFPSYYESGARLLLLENRRKIKQKKSLAI